MSRPEDRYSNDERGAAEAERYRAGSTRRAERLGREEHELPTEGDY